MPKVNIYNQQAEIVGETELDPKIFNMKANPALVHQAVVTQMANMRQVLAHTKGRGEVRGGGRKPWRQKGTGRARHGSIRSPIWRGGGVTFGPTKERNFKKDINKKMKQKAMLMVLSDKVANDNLVILDKLTLDEYKTKKFDDIISTLEKGVLKIRQPDSQIAGQPGEKKTDKKKKEAKKKNKRSILIINSANDERVTKSARNLPGIRLINSDNINILDLLKYRNLILTKNVVEKLEQRYK